jgi:DNA sulfur modification protein DndD
MIIESIYFYNAGIFRGEHSVNLAPAAPGWIPVVLIGGKNGRGKTTLLDSIHFVLYGKHAKLASRRGDQSWDDFLRDFMNRHAPRAEGAAIALEIRLHTEGVEHLLRVQREWKILGSKVKETLSVSRDGVNTPELAEDWADFVESLIPSQIAHLFLFDGEQIEALAAPDKSREILRTGIYGLLGADLIGRLEKDIQALNRKIKVACASVEDAKYIETLKQAYLKAEQRRDAVQGEVNDRKRAIEGKQKDLEQTILNIQAQGGHLLEERTELEAKESFLESKINELEEEMRRMQAGALPLARVLPLLIQMEAQAVRETNLQGDRVALARMETRDMRLLETLRNQKVSKQSFALVEGWLAQDRAAMAQHLEQFKERFEFSQDGVTKLAKLVHGGLDEENARYQDLEEHLREHKENLESLQRRLSRIPDPDAIRHLLNEREGLERSLAEMQGGLEALEGSLAEAYQEVNLSQRRYQKETAELKINQVAQAKVARQVEHLERARETVVKFQERIIARDIQRIEKEILLSVQCLFSKQKLIAGVSIDPATFQLSIRDSDGKSFSPLQLSAGERQLLAISVLWGLSKASGRSLPVFIDTPLGRLDHDHRDKLVSYYFHRASHQVVLLSTDEEITPARYERMSPWVGRVASLVFDESTQSSRFEAGRFFDDYQRVPSTPLFKEALS